MSVNSRDNQCWTCRHYSWESNEGHAGHCGRAKWSRHPKIGCKRFWEESDLSRRMRANEKAKAKFDRAWEKVRKDLRHSAEVIKQMELADKSRAKKKKGKSKARVDIDYTDLLD